MTDEVPLLRILVHFERRKPIATFFVPGGRMLYSARVNYDVSCPMEFSAYPVDTQASAPIFTTIPSFLLTTMSDKCTRDSNDNHIVFKWKPLQTNNLTGVSDSVRELGHNRGQDAFPLERSRGEGQ